MKIETICRMAAALGVKPAELIPKLVAPPHRAEGLLVDRARRTGAR